MRPAKAFLGRQFSFRLRLVQSYFLLTVDLPTWHRLGTKVVSSSRRRTGGRSALLRMTWLLKTLAVCALVQFASGWSAELSSRMHMIQHRQRAAARVSSSPQLMFSGIGMFLLSLFAFWKSCFCVPPHAVSHAHHSSCLHMCFAVEEMGSVRKLEKVDRLEQWDGTVGEGWELELEAKVALEQASLGCSIAVNGVCLTVTEFDDKSFKVGLAPETLRKTNLQSLSTGDPVNLERALPADGRNSGHFVQGHVDDVGVITEMVPDGDSLSITVKPPARLLPYIVPKGFIAIDGTSLTVVDVDQSSWHVFVHAHRVHAAEGDHP